MISHAFDVWAVVAAVITNGVLLVAAILAAIRPKTNTTSGDGAVGNSVVLIRPFRGLDADARVKHESLIAQKYEPYSVRFVCTSRDDPGLPVARSVCATRPHQASCSVADDDDDVVSDKARSMISAWRSSADPFVGFCDSDLFLHGDAIAQCMSAFDCDKVGAVFAHCIIDAQGALGRISMLTLTADAYALLIGCARLRTVPFLEGGLMILRRDAVERAGGIEMIAGAIGDDTRLGRQLRYAGFELRLAPFHIVHRSGIEGASEWLSRYRRWLACHRSEAPIGFWLELLLNPTVAPIAALAFGASRWGWEILGASIALRTMTTVFIDRALLWRHDVRLGWWSCLRPVSDIIHFCVCVSVVVHPWITWRGIRYAVGSGGNMVRAAEHASAVSKREAFVEPGAA